MKSKNFIPLIAAMALYLAVSFYYTLKLWNITEGKNLYALDDVYIHMAISKNFALHGVYGITRYYFSNASSSPLWTFLIGLSFKLLGLRIWIPFILALLSGILSLIALSYVYIRERISITKATIFLIAVVFLTSFWGLTFTGLEHLLQIFTMFMILWSATLVLTDENEKRPYYVLYVSSFLASVTRPESWSLIGGVFVLLALRRRWKVALSYLMISFLPVLLFGIWNKMNGNGFFPNTYYIKGLKHKNIFDLVYYSPNLTHLSAQAALVAAMGYLTLSVWEDRTLRNLSGLSTLGFSFILLSGMAKNLPVFLNEGVYIDRYYFDGISILTFSISGMLAKLAFLLILAGIYTGNLKPKREIYISFLLALVLVAHFHRGGLGWFFRYEAYLIALTLAFYPMLSSTLSKMRSSFLTLSITILSIPLFLRAFTILKDITPAVEITYLKNYNLARFVSEYLNGKGVAMDDIGYVSFLSDAKVVDFVGLGTYDVAEAIYKKRFNTDFMRELVKKYDIGVAILRPNWYVKYGGLPDEWLVVGTWKVEDIYYPGSNFLTFMATDESMAESLRVYMDEFKSYLPNEVTVRTAPPTPLRALLR